MKLLFNKVQELLALIRNDSHLHFEFTTAISFTVSKLLYRATVNVCASAAIGAATAFVIGVFKELCIDYMWRKEKFDWSDICANTIGSITGAIVSLV